MKIPYEELSEAALLGVIEEFIGREGTDYGESEISMATKVAQIRSQLHTGAVEIHFCVKSQSCTLVRVR